MKLHVDATPVEVGGVVVEGEFKIKNSPKAFMILASGLYSNKYRAILRELGANAKDSHSQAGKPDLPFTVHLPTRLNPVLSIRDYGVGLDHNGVTKLYTTYFESTKTESNDETGCLGLGSKSPFSYTKNFTVTAIYNGVKRIYSAFINERGIPAIATMNGEGTPTDECNGLEISFAVEDRNDMYQFAEEAKNVYRWFRVKPKIIGNDVEIADVVYSERNIVPGVHLMTNRSYNARSYAIMGDMAYPIMIPDGEKIPDKIRDLYRQNELAIEFQIGELDFAASREELSYIPMTVTALVKRGKQIIDGIEAHITKELSGCTTPWERATTLTRLKRNNQQLFGPGIDQYIKNNAALLPATLTSNYYGITVELKQETFTALAPDYRVTSSNMRNSTRRGNFINSSSLPTGQHQAEKIDVNELAIVFHDTKGSAYNRVKAEYVHRQSKSTSFKSRFLVLHPTRKDITKAEQDQQFAALVEYFGQPADGVIMRTSTFADPKGQFGTPKVRELGVLSFQEVRVSRYDTARRLHPTRVEEVTELDASLPDGSFLYVPVNNRTILGTTSDVTYDAEEFCKKMERTRIETMLGFRVQDKVYGIRKTAIKLVKNNPQWINFYDYINEKFDEIDWTTAKDDATKSITRKVIGEEFVFQTGTTLNHLQSTFIEYGKKDTPFGRLVKAYYDAKPKGKVTEAEYYEALLSGIHELFPKKNFAKAGIKMDLDEVRKSANKLVSDVKETYPVLKYITLSREYSISSDQWRDALQYVETVDKASE